MTIGFPRRFRLKRGCCCQSEGPPLNFVTAVTYVNSVEPVSFSIFVIRASAHFFFTSSRNQCQASLFDTRLFFSIDMIHSPGLNPPCQLLQLTTQTRSGPLRSG